MPSDCGGDGGSGTATLTFCVHRYLRRRVDQAWTRSVAPGFQAKKDDGPVLDLYKRTRTPSRRYI